MLLLLVTWLDRMMICRDSPAHDLSRTFERCRSQMLRSIALVRSDASAALPVDNDCVPRHHYDWRLNPTCLRLGVSALASRVGNWIPSIHDGSNLHQSVRLWIPALETVGSVNIPNWITNWRFTHCITHDGIIMDLILTPVIVITVQFGPRFTLRRNFCVR